jgi:prevent-host-death family protein
VLSSSLFSGHQAQRKEVPMIRHLSSRSSIEALRKEAKRWLQALRAQDPAAHERFRRSHPDAPVARIPASEFQREFGRLRGVAHREAVIVTSHGRDDVVLVSAEDYQRLRNLDRRAMHVSEISQEEIAALDAVEIPAEATRYNHEMT